ncbi:MAG: hypothetical protein M0R76_01635 [Proteobacteria bacterium]|nr:hypothetical protein [Pseudomonadota bacterium]
MPKNPVPPLFFPFLSRFFSLRYTPAAHRTAAGLLLCLALTASLSAHALPKSDHLFGREDGRVCEYQESLAEPWPVTEMGDLSAFYLPDESEVALIERLAQGIYRWKTKRDHGWWECGEFYPKGPETEDRAILLAYRMVRAVHLFGLGRDNGDLTPEALAHHVWGFAGTIANESSFDRCAVGYYFRKWAISKKMVKARTRTISYGEEEMLSALTDPRSFGWLQSTGVDIGYCQLLTRFHKGPLQEMMHPEQGLEICAFHFHERAKKLGTTRPWRYWRGYGATYYESRVVQRARAMGALPEEI